MLEKKQLCSLHEPAEKHARASSCTNHGNALEKEVVRPAFCRGQRPDWADGPRAIAQALLWRTTLADAGGAA